MRYRLTTRGKIVAVVFSILIISSGASLFNQGNVNEDSNIKEVADYDIDDTRENGKNSEILKTKENETKLENMDSKELIQDKVDEDIESYGKILREAASRVYFKPDKYNLADSEIIKIDKIIEIGKKHPKEVIIVEGNINGYPQYDDTEFGKTLSVKRAEVIKDYLVEKGIKKEMVHIFSLGSKKPIENTNNISESWKNRRTDIYFKGYNSLEY